MLAALASGYQGPPNLTVSRAFSSWTLDGWSLAWIAVLAALYLTGVAVIRRRGGAWPRAASSRSAASVSASP